MSRGGALAALAGFALAACNGGEAGSDRASAGPAVSTHAAARLAAACSGCHAGPDAAIASLDGRSAGDIARPMRAYRSQTDGTTVMHRLARGYTEDEIEAISTYLAASGGREP